MNVGSLFSGIGGFDLGLERAGMRVAWQCESDPFCRRVLAKHWPGVPCFEDVRDISSSTVGIYRPDVLCGGFPCQDLSLAGKGAGIDGARSGLWSEFARLVGELRPRYVIVENVPALLGRGAGRVLGDLAQVGYDAEWDCLPASAFGAPHRRDRFWLVAYPQRGGRAGWPPEPRRNDHVGQEAERREGPGDAPGGSTQAGAVADAEREGQSQPQGTERQERGWAGDGGEERVGGRAAQAGGPEWWSVEPPVGRVAHGVPDRLDQLAALGNALVPQIAEWLGRRILEAESERVAA